jgi:HSP20 family protein
MKTYYVIPRRTRSLPHRSRRIRAYRPVEFNGGRRLPVDVRVDDEGYSIYAPVPGLKPEQLRVEILDDVLTLHAGIEEENGHHEDLLQEWYRGPWIRKLRLPDSVDASQAEAKVEDGMLSLFLPKAEEARPRKIAVKAR